MAVREIRIYGDPVLREKAEPCAEIDDDAKRLAIDLLDTLAHSGGLGLAAPQIGVSRRALALAVGESGGPAPDAARVLFDPEVTERSGELVAGEEGCLSVPEIFETVKRPAWVRLRALAPDGSVIDEKLEGLPARVLLHELDHLDGVLFVDRIGPLRRSLLRKRLRALRA
jgi:peptide deformylase